jgi:two-component system, sensor histidine kinase PdtaS
MTIEYLPPDADPTFHIALGNPEMCPDTKYECDLTQNMCTEIRLREALLRQKEKLIQQQEVLSRESDHRLLNGMQMIVSLLSLQSRASVNPEAASQLTIAANRVAAILRVHRRLHHLDGAQTVAFKQYVEDLCVDFSALLPSTDSEPVIAVEGIEIGLPTSIGIPLGFIVNELITNAAKYGDGRITVTLESSRAGSYALSVSNDGPVLPEGFDPSACKGLGMKIIRSFIRQINGELRFGQGDNNQGAKFTVLFS